MKVTFKTDNRGGLELLRAGWDLERILCRTLCLCIARLQIPKLHSTDEGVSKQELVSCRSKIKQGLSVVTRIFASQNVSFLV